LVGGLGGLQEYLEYIVTMNWIIPLMLLSVGFVMFLAGFFIISPELLFAEAIFFGGALSIGIGEFWMLLGAITGAIGIGFALNPLGPRLPPSECQ
jgi:hypothetical protein